MILSNQSCYESVHANKQSEEFANILLIDVCLHKLFQEYIWTIKSTTQKKKEKKECWLSRLSENMKKLASTENNTTWH